MILRAIVALFLFISASYVWSEEPSSLVQKQQQARQQQAELRARIKQLEQGIAKQESMHKSADLALKESEAAISDTQRKLQQLSEQQKKTESSLQQLKEE